MTITPIALALTASLTYAPAPAEEIRTIEWIMPNGGTPSSVTWPQTLATAEALDQIPCGTSVWLQVDHYRYSAQTDRDRVDALTADGLLTWNGGPEDAGLHVHTGTPWEFREYHAPECVVFEPVTPVAPFVSASAVCDGHARIEFPEVLNGRWLDGGGVIEPAAPGEYTFGFIPAEGNFFLTEAEGFYIDNGVAYATIVVTPVPACPPVEPEPEPEPEPEREPERDEAPEGMLAETGSTPATPWLIAAAGGLLAGGAWLIRRARRAVT